MIELTLSEMKETQLNLLKEFSKYCDENGLVYFLGYGTLLGAVRHKGYIPWDDDIDVVMPRGDYERFIKFFKNDNIQVFNRSLNNSFPYTFAKLSNNNTILKEEIDVSFDSLGVNIDIFPLDSISNNLEEQKKNVRINRFCISLLKLKTMKFLSKRKLYKNLILLIGKSVLFLLDYRDIIKFIDSRSAKYKSNKSNSMGCLVWNYGAKEIMSKDIFSKSIKIEFENEFYNAPEKYDEYLKNLYGDYMTLPSEDKRVTHHAFKAYKKIQ
jgi:lipopolysaccharide cholinephosphotransferase